MTKVYIIKYGYYNCDKEPIYLNNTLIFSKKKLALKYINEKKSNYKISYIITKIKLDTGISVFLENITIII